MEICAKQHSIAWVIGSRTHVWPYVTGVKKLDNCTTGDRTATLIEVKKLQPELWLSAPSANLRCDLLARIFLIGGVELEVGECGCAQCNAPVHQCRRGGGM